MKKVYALAAAAAVALSANAQLYLVGSGDGLAWDLANPYVVELVDGNYTFTIDNLTEFKMSPVATTDWTEFNAGALYAAGLADEANLGKEIELVNGDANNSTPWKGTYTIVINEALTTLVAKTTTDKPSGPVDLYLRGGMNGWGAEELWKMETSDNLTFWFDCQGETMIPAGTEFKIADADWAAYNYTAGDIVVPFDEALPWFFNNQTNGVMESDYEGTIEIFIAAPRADAMCIVHTEIVSHDKASIEDVEVSEDAAVEYFNLQGVRVANPENGLYIRRQGDKVTKVIVK